MAAQDHAVAVGTSQPVSVLAEKLKEKNLAPGKEIKFFYCGREMKQSEPVGAYTTEDAVVTVFLRNAAS